MVDKRLDFLVIGAQKCATSWLYYCLKDHPNLYVPKKVEEWYLGGDVYQAKGADWYFSLFDGASADQKRGAVSVDYLGDHRSPGTIHEYAPDLKLIVVLREPVDRALSAYFWYVRKGLIPDKPLGEGLSIAVDAYKYSKSPQANPYYRDIIERGLYSDHLKRYLQHFNADRLLLILYDDIRDRPSFVLQEIYAFIGVESSYVPASTKRKPKHTSTLRSLLYFERMAPKSRVVSKLADLTSQFVSRLGIAQRKVALPKPLAQELQTVYQPDIERLKSIAQKIERYNHGSSRDWGTLWNEK